MTADQDGQKNHNGKMTSVLFYHVFLLVWYSPFTGGPHQEVWGNYYLRQIGKRMEIDIPAPPIGYGIQILLRYVGI